MAYNPKRPRPQKPPDKLEPPAPPKPYDKNKWGPGHRSEYRKTRE